MKIKTATRNGGTSATGSPTCLIFAFEIQRKIAVTCSHHTHFSHLFLYPFFSHFHPLKYILILSHAYAAIIPIFSHFFLHSNIFSLCSHHTHFSHLFIHSNIFSLSLMHMQPSYPFFSHFPPPKYLPILSHVYAAHMHACLFPRSSILGGSQIVCLLTTPSRAHAHGHLWHAIPPPHFIIFNSSYFDIKINFQIFNF